jgi:hypothetical protein
MRFAPRVSRLFPKLKVRTRLSLAFLIVILLSWLLNVQVFRYVIEQERQRVRREMAAQGHHPARPPHPPSRSPRARRHGGTTRSHTTRRDHRSGRGKRTERGNRDNRIRQSNFFRTASIHTCLR